MIYVYASLIVLQLLDNFPRDFCKGKILPQLLHAFQFGGAGQLSRDMIRNTG